MYDLTFNVNKNEDDLSKNISQIITINHRKVDRLISSNFFVIKLLVQHYQIELKMPYTISERYRTLINQYQEVYRNFDFHY